MILHFTHMLWIFRDVDAAPHHIHARVIIILVLQIDPLLQAQTRCRDGQKTSKHEAHKVQWRFIECTKCTAYYNTDALSGCERT
jgi:hypothetical protein